MPRIDLRKKIQLLTDEFAAEIGYNRKLPVSDPFYPYDYPKGDMICPNSDEPGCYVYADGAGMVQYMGKASRYIGNRL